MQVQVNPCRSSMPAEFRSAPCLMPCICAASCRPLRRILPAADESSARVVQALCRLAHAQAYEESRVCLHAIINTFPACIILGVLYDALAIGSHIE